MTSRIPGPIYRNALKRSVPSRTPGPLGVNDAAHPGLKAERGDTPGSLGHNDHAAARVQVSSYRPARFAGYSTLKATVWASFAGNWTADSSSGWSHTLGVR